MHDWAGGHAVHVLQASKLLAAPGSTAYHSAHFASSHSTLRSDCSDPAIMQRYVRFAAAVADMTDEVAAGTQKAVHNNVTTPLAAFLHQRDRFEVRAAADGADDASAAALKRCLHDRIKPGCATNS